MKISIRSVAALTTTVALSIAVLLGHVSAFNGPFRYEPLLNLAFYWEILWLIPCGLVLTTASIAYDQTRSRQAAMRGAAFGLILILLAVICASFPMIPA